jgi:hypothetical protein
MIGVLYSSRVGYHDRIHYPFEIRCHDLYSLLILSRMSCSVFFIHPEQNVMICIFYDRESDNYTVCFLQLRYRVRIGSGR